MSYSKVEVRSHELLKIEELLDAAADNWLQARAGQVPEELVAVLKAANASAFAQLKQFVTLGGEASDQENLRQGTPSHIAAKSPLLKPLSPPPVDGEVSRLEAEVNAASARVAELRISMQVRLQEELGARLAKCRPTAAIDGSEPAEGAAGEAAPGPEAMAVDGGPEPLSPAPQSMQAQLEAVAAKMPAVRAQLEQADERLRRVVAAVTAEVNRPAPNTVERAVAGKTPMPSDAAAAAAPGGEGAAPGSPDLMAALEAGQVSTRRRVARDVRPVPFPPVADDAPPA